MSRSWDQAWFVALLATIVFGLTLAPVVQSHAGSFKRFEPEDDPGLSVKFDNNPATVFLGAPCARTDLVWADVEAFHEEEPGETYDGTRVTMKLADLEASCPLDAEGQPESYYYAIDFKPQNWDWFRAWLPVGQTGGGEALRFTWWIDSSHWGNGCLGCGVVVDTEDDIIQFEIPTWLAVPPYEEAYIYTSMDSCFHSATDWCLSGQPPKQTKHGDVMPNVGTYCFFCE